MLVGGYQKLTLIDYPGKIAATVFTVGCSFRCPFCHNPELVNHGTWSLEKGTRMEQEFFQFLKKRKGKLEGVCITGGEPTIQPDIFEFINKIKKMGFFVKLDSNGSRPDVLKKILDKRLVDYVAMDIKHAPKKYFKASGMKTDIERIMLSADLLKSSKINFEFRTTVVPGIHQPEDFAAIGRWIGGASRYFLQRYREVRILDPRLKNITQGKEIDLKAIQKIIKPYFIQVGIRE